jgi:hypothetical protein
MGWNEGPGWSPGLTLGVVVSAPDTTTVDVALDKPSNDLRVPLRAVHWVSTGYLLSLAMGPHAGATALCLVHSACTELDIGARLCDSMAR